MATELLATGNTAANSSDITVADGGSATIFLKAGSGANIPAGVRVNIQIKDSANAYNTIGYLDALNPSTVIAAKGVYRVSRVAGAYSVGVGQG